MAVAIPIEAALSDLVVLRRATRAARAPGQRERLARVEERLRRAVGPSVPKLAAARALGVSLTALDRWIDRGLIPVVRQPRSSRLRPETRPLLELLEQVELLREQGQHDRILATALRRLGRRPVATGRWVVSAELAALPRPNPSARELREAAAGTTPLDRLDNVAALSEALSVLSLAGARARR